MLDIALEVGLDGDHYIDSVSFQSFLCWILLWKFNTGLYPFLVSTFQSFLCWILLWKASVKAFVSRLDSVSILLMLDIALEETLRITIASCHIGFNPSYAGYCSGS